MKKIICLGDSITAADRFFCTNSLGNGYAAMLPSLLPDCEIINKGIDGFTISRVLQNVKQDCINLKPDFVTIQIGINNIGLIMNTNRTSTQQKQMLDSYIQEYIQLLTLITENIPAGIVLIEPFIFPYPKEFTLWIPYVKELSGHIRHLADTFRCKFLPLHDLLNQKAQQLGYDAVTADGIHLTSHGHQIIARQLSRLLTEKFEN